MKVFIVFAQSLLKQFPLTAILVIIIDSVINLGDYIPEGITVVLYGSVGIGKTHMAIAEGIKACNLGYKTNYEKSTLN